MRIKDGFELIDICGESVIVAHGKENIDFSKVISLNESAAYLWRAVIGSEFDAPSLARLLTDEYEVDEATALRDAEKVIADWCGAGLAE